MVHAYSGHDILLSLLGNACGRATDRAPRSVPASLARLHEGSFFSFFWPIVYLLSPLAYPIEACHRFAVYRPLKKLVCAFLLMLAS
jgi:hypothetical protein